MLSDVMEQMAAVLRTDIGGELSSDGIDIVIEPRLVMSPSEALVIDIYQASPSRDSEAAAFGDISGFYVLTVRARANVNDSTEAQDILRDMTDDQHPLSIAASLDSTLLNGYATQVVVDGDSFSGLLEWPPMVGCTWRVLVGVAIS